MGVIRFRVPKSWELPPARLKSVHVIGIDGIPKPCSVRVIEKTLEIHRNETGSGRVYFSYPFATRGELMICTGTLPESEVYYDLLTELARGTLNRLRNQMSIWQEGGLELPGRIEQLASAAGTDLCQSITGSESDRYSFAALCLEKSMEGIFGLSRVFGQSISEFRVSHDEIPAFWFGVQRREPGKVDGELASCADFIATDSTEPFGGRNRKRILGPLLDIGPKSSFAKRGDNFQMRRQASLERCRKLIEELPPDTALIHAACGLSGVAHQYANYSEQFHLTAEVLNLLEDSGITIPIMVSFDYPFAEQLGSVVGAGHPLQIAEDLMRNGVRISYLGLDINLDYWPNGSVSRDPLQWIDLIDSWCQPGLPLVLCLRIPQPAAVRLPDAVPEFRPMSEVPATLRTDETGPGDETQMEIRSSGITNIVRENLTADQRLQLVETVVKMAVARPGVHGIIWRQWSDADDPRFPMGGLVDEDGNPKKILSSLCEFRLEMASMALKARMANAK